ncbi:hypothetical protein K438DRAFT_1785295 [Mycena galopus ATCC 62051]|nr:hypothetical protein K438DRAFT_1785295 [Mycena galopus ATCC 62051]
MSRINPSGGTAEKGSHVHDAKGDLKVPVRCMGRKNARCVAAVMSEIFARSPTNLPPPGPGSGSGSAFERVRTRSAKCCIRPNLNLQLRFRFSNSVNLNPEPGVQFGSVQKAPSTLNKTPLRGQGKPARTSLSEAPGRTSSNWCLLGHAYTLKDLVGEEDDPADWTTGRPGTHLEAFHDATNEANFRMCSGGFSLPNKISTSGVPIWVPWGPGKKLCHPVPCRVGVLACPGVRLTHFLSGSWLSEALSSCTQGISPTTQCTSYLQV